MKVPSFIKNTGEFIFQFLYSLIYKKPRRLYIGHGECSASSSNTRFLTVWTHMPSVFTCLHSQKIYPILFLFY